MPTIRLSLKEGLPDIISDGEKLKEIRIDVDEFRIDLMGGEESLVTALRIELASVLEELEANSQTIQEEAIVVRLTSALESEAPRLQYNSFKAFLERHGVKAVPYDSFTSNERLPEEQMGEMYEEYLSRVKLFNQGHIECLESSIALALESTSITEEERKSILRSANEEKNDLLVPQTYEAYVRSISRKKNLGSPQARFKRISGLKLGLFDGENRWVRKADKPYQFYEITDFSPDGRLILDGFAEPQETTDFIIMPELGRIFSIYQTLCKRLGITPFESIRDFVQCDEYGYGPLSRYKDIVNKKLGSTNMNQKGGLTYWVSSADGSIHKIINFTTDCKLVLEGIDEAQEPMEFSPIKRSTEDPGHKKKPLFTVDRAKNQNDAIQAAQ